MGDQVAEAIVCFEVPRPNSRGGFIEPNKNGGKINLTDNKFTYMDQIPYSEGLRHC